MNEVLNTYAAYYDNKVRLDSSSGGLFSLIASQFEVVYGVEMDENNQYAVFARKEKDFSSLRGSKYIQAKVGDAFKQVKQDLVNNKSVLFSGTACQVNGLHTFLQKDYPNLFTIDVVCHGAPTPKYWHKFIEGKEVKKINFRSKEVGWQNYGMKLNDKYIPNDENKYMLLYWQKNYCIRPSCYECVCKQDKKSDITLGDFWGIDNVASELNDNKGMSLVITRSEKGDKFFESLKNALVWKEVTYEDGVRYNPSEYSSAAMPENREKFYKDMERMSFDDLYKKYMTVPLWKKCGRKVKQLLKRILEK